MRVLYLSLARLRSLILRRRVESELDEELRLHIEREIEERIERGASPEQARSAALRAFGGVAQFKEECRRVRGSNFVDALVRDTRHAVRRLGRDWRFSVAAVLILALGIGANTAVFSVVNTVLFRPQPFDDPHRLVDIYQDSDDGDPMSNSFPAYRDMTAYEDVFSEVAATYLSNLTYETGGPPRPVIGEFVTANYFPLLGLDPSAGRWLDAHADASGSESVAVVSFNTWRSVFGRDPTIIGRSIRLNGAPVTVVGVGPEGYNNSVMPGLVTDFWLSLSSLPPVLGGYAGGVLERRQDHPFLVKARLREGVSFSRAQAAMDALSARLSIEFPALNQGRDITVIPSEGVRIHPLIDGFLAPAAVLLMLIVGLVLAIACGNLATLFLVRGASRSREVSVRLALGATRPQLVRHLLTESILLSVAGGVLGYTLALWAVRWSATLDPSSALPFMVDLSLDYRVLAFTCGLSLLTGVVFGLAPALKSIRTDLVSTLREEVAALSLQKRSFSLKNALVIFQVAGSFLLLVGAGLFIRSLVNARELDVGFAVHDVALVQTVPQFAGYTPPRARILYEDLLASVRAIPGVESASIAAVPPVSGLAPGGSSLIIEGFESTSGTSAVEIPSTSVSPGYFETLRIPILYGRGFTEDDDAEAPSVVVINETMARRYFQTADAVGRRFRPQASASTEDSWIRVVGVVADSKTSDVTLSPGAFFYRSWSQPGISRATVIARTVLDPSILVGEIERELTRLDPSLPVTLAKTMKQHLRDSLVAPETMTAFMTGLGLLALGLASIGLYAVVAFAVSRRSVEVGIRMALGAPRRRVVWMIIREAALLVAIGLLLGVGLSLAATRAIAGLLYDVSALDPATFLTVALLMFLVAVMAAYFPARRSVGSDPMVALRHE